MNELKVHDRLEQAGIDFHQRTFEGYMKIMKEKLDRVIVIDASGTKFETRGYHKSAYRHDINA